MLNLKKLILVGVAGGATVVMGLTGAGCSSWGHKSTSERSEGRQLDDKLITEQVQEKLKNEPVYKFTDVDVKTFAGVVQLSGFVTSEEQKQRAGQLAQDVDGVARVVNNVTLKPPPALTPTGATNEVQKPSAQPPSGQ